MGSGQVALAGYYSVPAPGLASLVRITRAVSIPPPKSRAGRMRSHPPALPHRCLINTISIIVPLCHHCLSLRRRPRPQPSSSSIKAGVTMPSPPGPATLPLSPRGPESCKMQQFRLSLQLPGPAYSCCPPLRSDGQPGPATIAHRRAARRSARAFNSISAALNDPLGPAGGNQQILLNKDIPGFFFFFFIF